MKQQQPASQRHREGGGGATLKHRGTMGTGGRGTPKMSGTMGKGTKTKKG